MIEPLRGAVGDFILCLDALPPIGQKLLMRTAYGPCIVGTWHPEYGVVAWMPMPTYSPEQRARLAEAEAAGVDMTRPAGE